MSGKDPGDGYVPTDLDAAVPADPAARAAREAEMEAITTRRDLLTGRLARLRAALYAAEGAADTARAATLAAEIAVLSAERGAL